MAKAWYGPNGYGDSDPVAGTYKWMDAIQPYVKSTQLFHCPDYNDDLGLGQDGVYVPYQQLTSASHAHYGSYAMNAAYWDGAYNDNGISSPGGSSQGITSFSLATLSHPATTAWIADGEGGYQFDWPNTNPPVVTKSIRTWGSGTVGDGSCGERHTGFVNVIWCDGHAKAIGLDALMQTKSVTTGTGAHIISPLLVVQDYTGN